MIGEVVESKIRTRKKQTEENSEVIERIVANLVGKYTRDMDNFLYTIKEKIDNNYDLTDKEIENITIKVPIYLYFASEGVEVLGIQGDNAKLVKLEQYNDFYIRAEGTINDKTSQAELATIPEHLLEVAYIRAYRTVKAKLDAAENICHSIRKVLSKRMQNNDLIRLEGNKTVD